MSATNTTYVYCRVSTTEQSLESQKPDLERWLAANGVEADWYSDKFTGTTMERPGWKKLEAAVRAGKVKQIVVWRIDRLGRTAAGLTALFDNLQQRGVNLVSIKEGIDLSTPAGRFMATVIAGMAQWETESRRERQMAGIAVAKTRGVYRGRKPGATKAKPNKAAALRSRGFTLLEIGRQLGVSPETAGRYLRKAPV